jgi:hypothetical protein
MKLIVPIVHSNGTSRSALIEQYSEAYRSVGADLDKLCKIETHDRDYYVHPTEGAGRIARARRAGWLKQLGDIRQELQAIGIAIQANHAATTNICHTTLPSQTTCLE